MSVARNVNWTSLSTKLKPETMASLNAFRRRHADLQKTLVELKEQDTAIDFSHYRKVLKNTKVIDNAEKALKGFKPATYDLTLQIKMIEDAKNNAVCFYFTLSKSVNLFRLAQSSKNYRRES